MSKPPKPIFFPLRLSHEFDRLIHEMIERRWGIPREIKGWNPSIDLYETADAFILEADLPGVKREDVHVAVEGHSLILQGTRTFNETYSDGGFHYQERGGGNFFRQIELRESVDKERIQAEFENGVLRVILPKIKSRID